MLEAPEEERVVGMARAVYGNVPGEAAGQRPGYVRQRVRYLEVWERGNVRACEWVQYDCKRKWRWRTALPVGAEVARGLAGVVLWPAARCRGELGNREGRDERDQDCERRPQHVAVGVGGGVVSSVGGSPGPLDVEVHRFYTSIVSSCDPNRGDRENEYRFY